jgi:hypothetical protein
MKAVALFFGVVFFASGVWAQADRPGTTDEGEKVIATVLGKKITLKEKDKLNGIVFGALLEQFAKENKIEPTDEELDSFIIKTEEKQRQMPIKFEKDRQKLIEELKTDKLSEKERTDKEKQLKTIENILRMTREMEEKKKDRAELPIERKRKGVERFVRSWKINKALFEKYGGRVIFQQAGVEPLDAYRDFLKEQEKLGNFQIIDKQYEADFWKYFTNDAMHTFYPKDKGAKFINTPWWMMDEPPEQEKK